MENKNLRFLTRSYNLLQGLRLVPLGALLAGWILVEPVWPKSNLRDTVQLALLVAAIFGFILVGRYYENRFGRVKQNAGCVVAALGLIALVAALRLDEANPPVSLLSILAACFFVGGAIASGGRRWYSLVPAGAFIVLGVLPMAAVASVKTVDGRPCAITFGLALVFTGVLDHLLLVRGLSGPADA